MRVELVQVTRSRETVVGVRALATGRVLFACSGAGERGAARSTSRTARRRAAISAEERPRSQSASSTHTLPSGSARRR